MDIKYYSIGCDCYSANILKLLHLRHLAGPFDHIYTGSIYSPEYFSNLVDSSFKNFLSDLSLNNNNKVVSKHYPFTEFTHDDDLINTIDTKYKYQRRITRFMNDYKNAQCVFLLNINYDSIMI